MLPLEPILVFEALHDGEHTVVEHRRGRYLPVFGDREPDVGAAVQRTPLEPGVVDHKRYRRGVGEVREESVRGATERLLLVSVRRGGA